MEDTRHQILRINSLGGLTDYEDAHRLQLETVELRKLGKIPDTLILLEHPPVITLGRNANTDGVIATSKQLSEIGVRVHRVERGGKTTYHGPGQIVGYPIVSLHDIKMGIARYVSNLEEVMIRAAESMGVTAQRLEGTTGVFAKSGVGPKIGAIGVRVTRGITYHGFAFNVDPNLTHYQLIVPCGMTQTPVSSITALGGKAPKGNSARDILVKSFAEVFGYESETSSNE